MEQQASGRGGHQGCRQGDAGVVREMAKVGEVITKELDMAESAEAEISIPFSCRNN